MIPGCARQASRAWALLGYPFGVQMGFIAHPFGV